MAGTQPQVQLLQEVGVEVVEVVEVVKSESHVFFMRVEYGIILLGN